MCDTPGCTTVMLNCVVLVPEDGQALYDSALPLSVPCADKPIFNCRSWFMQEMRTTLGFDSEIDVRQLRFWKPRTPISSNVPSDPKSQRLQILSRFDESFLMIPFTESLGDSLGSSVDEHNIIHLVIDVVPAGLQRDAFSTTFRRSKLDLTFPMTVTVGHHTIGNQESQRTWEHVAEGEHHSKDLSYPLTPTLPIIVLGLRALDIGPGWDTGDPVDINTSADNVRNTSFRCHISSWGSTRLYDAGVDWLVAPSAPLLQAGSVDSQHYRCERHDGGDVIERIEFDTPFSHPPKVFVVISGFGLGNTNHSTTHWDIRTFATNVEKRGFTINIITTREGDGGLAYGQVHWLAFPEGGIPGVSMCCGDLRSNKTSFGGHVDFDVEFKKEPKIFLALNQFDAAKVRNLRVRVEASNVLEKGMDWKISTWDDTNLYSASASFLAIEDC